jgi:D-alanine-D-alanine ligase
MEIEVDKEWWKEIFDEVYLRTDARSVCDDDLTRREIDYIVNRLNIGPDDHILDLCGGQGRHALELIRRGYSRITLLDYSPHLLEIGQKTAGDQGWNIAFVRGDARQAGLRSDHFRYIFILGSSFGYFVEDRENMKILNEAFRLLYPGGKLLLDLPLRKSVEQKFKPVVHHTVDDDIDVTRTRLLEDGVIYACETIISKTQGVVRKNSYCTRLYRPATIARLLKTAGFKKVEIESDYMDRSGKGDFGTLTNRMIVAAEKG